MRVVLKPRDDVLYKMFDEGAAFLKTMWVAGKKFTLLRDMAKAKAAELETHEKEREVAAEVNTQALRADGRGEADCGTD